MISIEDKILSDRTAAYLKENNITGVVLFNHNVVSGKQLKRLTDDLKNKVNPNILIAVDQEGGDIVRIPWDSTAGISPSQIGRKGDLDYAYNVAYKRADFLKKLGINVILGPVADIADSKKSYIYRRCFGTDPAAVSSMVRVTVKAQKDAGIITVLKHFPGHGKTSVDSHVSFPYINIPEDELINRELLPFKSGIEAGAEMIMIGHIINRSIDKYKPASISPEYLNILEKIDFNGIVITDDLKMTGNINSTIGWGINLITGSFQEISWKMSTIEPVDKYLEKVLKLVHRDHLWTMNQAE